MSTQTREVVVKVCDNPSCGLEITPSMVPHSATFYIGTQAEVTADFCCLWCFPTNLTQVADITEKLLKAASKTETKL